MKAKWWGEGGGGERHEIVLFLPGGNRNSRNVCWGQQFIFMNLNPIPGAPPWWKKVILPWVRLPEEGEMGGGVTLCLLQLDIFT